MLAEPLPAPRAFVRQFSPVNGLTQPLIYCLLQDKHGYLWLGTTEGLARYDSTRFTTLIIHNGLAEILLTGLWKELTTGHLWLANYQGDRSVRMAPITTFQALTPS
jgi:ligand-binding sensor domain-containing protein